MKTLRLDPSNRSVEWHAPVRVRLTTLLAKVCPRDSGRYSDGSMLWRAALPRIRLKRNAAPFERLPQHPASCRLQPGCPGYDLRGLPSLIQAERGARTGTGLLPARVRRDSVANSR